MPLLSKKTVLAAKQESVAGTPESLSGTDAIYAKNVKITPEFEVIGREDDGSLGKRTAVIGGQKAKVSFEVELKGSGNGTVSPKWASVFLPACGMVEANGTWSTTSNVTNMKPCTIAAYQDGRVEKLGGVCLNAAFEMESGKVGMVKFEGEGLWVPVADATLLTPEADTVKPPRITGANITLGGATAPISKLSIDLGNKVVCREDETSSVGYTYAIIVDRDVKGKIDPEATLVATSDSYGTFRSGTEMSFSFAVGATAGNTITIAGPKAQYKAISDGERNQIITHDLELQFNKSAAAGNDELTIAFS